MSSQKYLLSAILILAAAAGFTLGQLENCHTTILTPHHFLDIDKFLGVWYPLKVAPSKAHQVWPLNYTCINTNMTRSAVNNVLDFEETYVNKDNNMLETQKSLVVLGEIRPEMPIPAIWSNYYTPPGSNETLHSHSVIIASDESSWAVHYSCGVKEGELLERISIWSRERTLNPKIYDVLDTFAWGVGFPFPNFQTIDQTNCPNN